MLYSNLYYISSHSFFYFTTFNELNELSDDSLEHRHIVSCSHVQLTAVIGG